MTPGTVEPAQDLPAMSVIAITRGSFSALARLFAHLRDQTIQDRLEVVIAAPSRRELCLDESELTGFHGVKLVETGSAVSNPIARAAAIRAATAPIVALTEEHSFPEPEWAATLLAAHGEGCAAVGPAIINANPRTAVSWANLLVEYGHWVDRPKDDRIDHLPGHNGSYRRDILLAYGDDLAAMLEAESVLHWDLRKRGHRLCLEPGARTRHLTVSRWSITLPLRFSVGRSFAGSRARAWHAGRRLLYAAAGPLIPCIRFRRAHDDLRRVRARRPVPRGVGAVLLAILIVDGLGEMIGYAFGSGRANETLTALEFDRLRHIRADEDRMLDGRPCR